MATELEIINTILLAKSFQSQLTDELLAEQKSGCMDCKSPSEINRIDNLVMSLERRIQLNLYDNDTDEIYNCLLTAICNYDGLGLSVDPNASVPNIVIDVTLVGDQRPDWLDIPWEDMTNDVDGYRDTYTNTKWINWNPMIQIMGVVMYQVGVDYDNDGNGTITFRDGKGLFEGQFFRAGNYQEYTPPTPSYPPAGTYRLVNNSAVDTEYFIDSTIPLVVGETVNAPFTSGESLLAIIMDTQQLVFNRYLSDGTLDFTITLNNPPSTQLSTGVMDLTKSYEFIFYQNF